MSQFLVLGAMLLAMYALIVIPQNRRDRKKREMLEALQIGDEIVTNAGIYGVITEFDGPTIFLAIDNNVEIKLSKEAISEHVVYEETEETGSK